MVVLGFITILLSLSLSTPRAHGSPQALPMSCQKLETQQLCALPKQKSSAQEACEIEQKTYQCEEYIKLHPQLKDSGKLKNCQDIVICDKPASTQDFIKTCAVQMGQAWKDMAVGAFEFLTGQAGLPSEQDLAKLDYFKNCTSVECKRQMLGDFQKYFSKEEIEGHTNDKNLDPQDIANKNYLEGYSAAVLYRKLLQKLKKDFETRGLEEKFIEPWSGDEARLPLSFNQLIDRVLQKAGITHTGCFKPEVVNEMRCYAFFSVVDPLLVVGVAAKLPRIAGIIGKGLEKTGEVLKSFTAARKAEETATAIKSSAKAELVPSGNAQIDIWQAREAGQNELARSLEEKLIHDMQTGKVKGTPKQIDAGGFGAMYVELDNGVKGVWKPHEFGGLEVNSHAETFASRLDRHLEENIVPITIDRELDGKKGTFQYFIDGAKDGPVEYPENFMLFDYLIENGDRNGGNYMVRPDGRKIAIDHGLALSPSDVLDFPRHIDGVINRQKQVERQTQSVRDEYTRAQRAGVGPKQLKKLAEKVKAAETQAKIAKAKAQQEITAMGVSARGTVKLSDSTTAEWNKVLGNLSETEKKDFFVRKEKALQAIERAYNYFGDAIYSVGPYSSKFKKPTPLEHPLIEELQGSGL